MTIKSGLREIITLWNLILINIFLLTNQFFFVFLSTKHKWLWTDNYLRNALRMQGLCAG